MATDTEIVNAALSKLGEPRITSFDDDTKSGRLANSTFSDIRDALLREFPWNFATTRAELAAEVTAPVWGFARSFVLPPDYLRLIDVENPLRMPWRIESGRIVTDLEAPLQIKYVRRVDSGEMDSTFREVLAARLALEWAEPLTAQSAIVDRMAAFYKEKLPVARASDGQEDHDATRKFDASSWIESRW